MKNSLALLAMLLCPSFVFAQFNTTFRCASGEIFQVSGDDTQLTLQRGLYQKVTGPSRLELAHVISASGARYSDGDYTVWLKGNDAMLLQGEQPLATDCSASRDDEPLTPIRDAASGVVFIPPERWQAKEVILQAHAGSDIPFYGDKASHQLQYSYRAPDGQIASLLTILVFSTSQWQTMTPPPNAIQLGSDGQRVYIAQINQDNAFDPASAAGKRYALLQTRAAEVSEAFSMYGVVVNQAVETVQVQVSWLERSLRPGSEQIVELRDISQGEPGEVVAKHRLVLEKGAPKAITLRFDPSAINPKHNYVIVGQLQQQGRVVLKSAPVAVLTQGQGRIAAIILKKIEKGIAANANK